MMASRTARLARLLQHLQTNPASSRGEGGGLKFADAPSPTRTENGVNFTIGPDYTPAPEIAAGAPKGTVHELVMKSEDSNIYPGIKRSNEARDALVEGVTIGKGPGINCIEATPDLSMPGVHPYERQVAVYVPSGHEAGGGECPFIVVHDGIGYVQTMAPTLDALIAEGRVPKNLVAIFLNSGGSDAQGSQRGLEYDTMDGVFAEFVDTEVVPFVEAACGVILTSDARGRATMGGSSGGSCAFAMAWYKPTSFSKVLTYSGTCECTLCMIAAYILY
jgi:hypothetical protein